MHIVIMHLQLPSSCFILVVLSHFSVCENEGDSLHQCAPTRTLANLTSGNRSEIHISFVTQESEIVNIKASSYNLEEVSDWAYTRTRPFLKISSCVRPGCDFPTPEIFHTLFIAPELVYNSNASDCPIWTIALPAYLDGDCAEVHISESHIGIGGVTPGLSVRLESNAEDGEGCNCSCNNETMYEGTVVTLVESREGDYYSIMYHDRTGDILNQTLPQCVTTGVVESALWMATTSCMEEQDTVRFIPSGVYLTSQDELFITGNGLLYSLNRDSIYYQLLLPTPIKRIRNFVLSVDFKAFAVTVTLLNDIAEELWLGFAGTPGVVRLYPSTLLNHLWNLTGAEAEETWPLLLDTRLAFIEHNQLYLITGDTSTHLPLPLLIAQHLLSHNHSSICSSDILTRHPLDLFSSGVASISSCPIELCPFSDVSLKAIVCSDVTRSQLHYSDTMRSAAAETLPEYTCSYGNYLPRDVFLQKLETYTIVVTFWLHNFVDESNASVRYSAWTSDSVNLDISINGEYLEEDHSQRYEISVTEQGLFTEQYVPGYVITSAVVDLQIPGVALQCIDPLSRQFAIPGSYRTRVHIGCPPGLSLTFDPVTTSSHDDQNCIFNSNGTSCYHFRNVFYPAFLISDEVTGISSPFIGLFTLDVVGGGLRKESLTMFNRSRNVEYGMWISLDDGVFQNGSGLRWVCVSRSLCGEIPPTQGSIPHYYIMLEASTSEVMANQSYCVLSVQFLIRLHGMPMGPVTAILFAISGVILLLLLVMVSFVISRYREAIATVSTTCFGSIHNKWMRGRSNEWLIQSIRDRKPRNLTPSSDQ